MTMDGPCLNEHDRRRAVREILENESICYEAAARTLLTISHDMRLEWAGGYPAEIDWDFFPDHVVAADAGGSDYNEPMLVIYDKEAVCDLAQDAIDDVHTGEDGEELTGDDRIDAIIDRFEDGIEDCRADTHARGAANEEDHG